MATMKMLINIDVPQLGPAIAFYCGALPLSLRRIIDDDVAELSGASSDICLLQTAAGSSPAKGIDDVRHYRRHWTPVHIDFVVDNIEHAAKRAIEAGALQEGECIEWRGSRWISFSDPWGHGFCLIEFTGDGYSGTD